MTKYIPSDTYKFFFNSIIADYLKQILDELPHISIKDKFIPYTIGEKFEEYRCKVTPNMKSSRLDRHKLASCICGAILEVKPLVSSSKGISIKQNEKFALYVGLGLIKHYMMYNFLVNLPASSEDKRKIKIFLAKNFDMSLPSVKENICDIQDYETNLINALYWTNHKCDITCNNCFQYDIWAYAKIFYHLELYNKSKLNDTYMEYLKTNNITKEQEN